MTTSSPGFNLIWHGKEDNSSITGLGGGQNSSWNDLNQQGSKIYSGDNSSGKGSDLSDGDLDLQKFIQKQKIAEAAFEEVEEIYEADCLNKDYVPESIKTKNEDQLRLAFMQQRQRGYSLDIQAG